MDQKLSQLWGGIIFVSWDYASDQLGGSGGSELQDHDRLMDGFVLRKASRDIAWLDAVSADLDLVVEPAEELKHTVRPPTDAVAGAIKSGTWLAGKSVGEEAPLGHLGLANVTERDAVATGE
jgi:hypothetical protein